MYFDKRLCMFHQIFATQDELFETMFKTMFQAGVVKSDYLEGIKEEEEEKDRLGLGCEKGDG